MAPKTRQPARGAAGRKRPGAGPPSTGARLAGSPLAASPLAAWPPFTPGCSCQVGWQAFRDGMAVAADDDLAAAEPLLRQAAVAEPRMLAPTHLLRGRLLLRIDEPARAVAEFRAALRITPGVALVEVSLGHALLLMGEYGPGWAALEARRRLDFGGQVAFPTYPQPEWRGETMPGTLLVRAEQGMGDCLMFARYLPAIARRVGRLVLACHDPLLPLLATMPGVAEVVSMLAPPPDFDRWVLLGSVPLVFETTLATIPFAAGFLQADAARRAGWAARLPAGRRVGLVWAGNPDKEDDAKRSIPLAALRPLLAVPGMRFLSLQVGAAGAAAAGVAGLLDITADLTDFAETAAAVAELDLVITVDTAVAHLAGALGRPCWLLCPIGPDWRWLLGREDSPWYSSIRLFRQRRRRDWSEPVARMVELLHARR